MKARLQKVLASMGIASRRQAEAMILRGEVVVNGHVAQIGESVDPDIDAIEVHGRKVSTQIGEVYLALNKPRGYVTSTRAIGLDPTVMKLLGVEERIFPVGRLDKDTSGLLLLTNDGDWANLVTHPRYMVEKEYGVLVRGEVSASDLERMRKGVELTGGLKTVPAGVKKVKSSSTGNTLLFLTLMEGKKRQIRDMCQAVGHPVLSLERVRVGGVQLGNLGLGKWRHLEPKEVEGIREQAGQARGPGPTTGSSHRH